MKIQLDNTSPLPPKLFNEEEAKTETQKYIHKIGNLQEAMMAEGKYSLLVIFQSRDASGKDGVIKHVFSGINPSGVNVISFKVPSVEEFSHDPLWRIHKVTPSKGKIAVFNRSQYEDILVPTVHKLAPEPVIKKRYGHINCFEEMLKDNNTVVLKYFLHISQEEQQRRFKKRMHNPKKLWKFSKKDVNESKLWNEYSEVYESIFHKCPGFKIIPADNKHYRNFLVAKDIYSEMKKLKCKYPNKISD